jgi:hypothetical protein
MILLRNAEEGMKQCDLFSMEYLKRSNTKLEKWF